MAKRKMQNVNFKNVEEFLDSLPIEELNIVEVLRSLIFSCAPDIKEKLNYNVPFYTRHKRLFYIWPPAVDWGNVHHKTVHFGFANGYLLNDEMNYLEIGNRKIVRVKEFKQVNEIEADVLKSFIFQAIELDEQFNSKTAKPKKT